MINSKKIIVAVSGYFNPVHKGHIRLFKEAKKLGDELVVILNNDNQVKLKGSVPFMNQRERSEVVSALECVDSVFLSIDKDRTICESLKVIEPHIFANGGDRRNTKEIPESKVCKELGIKMVFKVGGRKIQSSSSLIKNIKKYVK